MGQGVIAQDESDQFNEHGYRIKVACWMGLHQRRLAFLAGLPTLAAGFPALRATQRAFMLAANFVRPSGVEKGLAVDK